MTAPQFSGVFIGWLVDREPASSSCTARQILCSIVVFLVLAAYEGLIYSLKWENRSGKVAPLKDGSARQIALDGM